MRAATTKIQHLLYEKDLLKTLKVMYDFFTIYDLFTMNIYDGDKRKTSKYIKWKPRKKFPVWLPSHPPVYENGGWLFSGVRKHWKQAGLTLGGMGTLV